MMRFAKFALAAALALAPLPAFAAASLQVTHAFLCAPEVSGGATGPRLVVNTASTATPQPSYQLNSAGCALIATPDVGFFSRKVIRLALTKWRTRPTSSYRRIFPARSDRSRPRFMLPCCRGNRK